VGKKRWKNNKPFRLIEMAAVYSLFIFCRICPMPAIRLLSLLIGKAFYLISKKRRIIAYDNIRLAYAGEKSKGEIETIAAESFKSLVLTIMEFMKFHNLKIRELLNNTSADIKKVFEKAKNLHEESGGCIFATPHIGSWELLPHVSAALEIPMVIVARPLDNGYLEKTLFKKRIDSGQMIIPKRNALFTLQKTLQSGKSIGILPDQSTKKGIYVDFFGRKAYTTPVPAILSVTYKRPIVVVACCRSKDGKNFEGVVSDPIYPQEYKSEREEIIRITTEMNKKMEAIINKYPEQYLWMHNRWKTYEYKK
jgi:KDO2-lipid IV(A) lauroyltransferase